MQWRKKRVGQRCHSRAALVDDVFKYFGRFLKQDCGARFADGNICARGKRAVEPGQRYQVAARIHNGDHAAGRFHFLRFCFCGGDDAFRAVERQGLFFSGLAEGNRAREKPYCEKHDLAKSHNDSLSLRDLDGGSSLPFGTTARPWSCGPNYITGELKLASPRFTSAKAHQITTFLTFFT